MNIKNLGVGNVLLVKIGKFADDKAIGRVALDDQSGNPLAGAICYSIVEVVQMTCVLDLSTGYIAKGLNEKGLVEAAVAYRSKHIRSSSAIDDPTLARLLQAADTVIADRAPITARERLRRAIQMADGLLRNNNYVAAANELNAALDGMEIKK